MDDKKLRWLWLHEVLGPCNGKFRDLINEYEFIETIYDKRETAPMAAILSPGEYKRARERTLDSSRQLLEDCNKEGISLLCYTDEDYPARLRSTRYPPAVLFVTGDPAALNRPLAVAGVGARFSTKYGRDAVRHICTPLAKAGIALISGMAYGIDAEVHKIALEQGGPTVAVLGTPIDNTYPAQHAELRRQIEQSGGAVVSEYAPGTVTNKSMFAQRNRIIAGLSRAVIIFEAAKKSGTMITATWALDDGRDVFAVPGSILSTHSEGTNYLIKQGAGVATSALDIIEALDLHETAFEQLTLEQASQIKLNAAQKKICGALEEGDLTLDGLAEKTGLLPHQLLAELTGLEIDGVIEALGGSRYALKIEQYQINID